MVNQAPPPNCDHEGGSSAVCTSSSVCSHQVGEGATATSGSTEFASPKEGPFGIPASYNLESESLAWCGARCTDSWPGIRTSASAIRTWPQLFPRSDEHWAT